MILCCGEALIDMIPEPTDGGRTGFVPHSGGAIFNTARALGRLGVEVGMLTGLSEDMFGQQLEQDLRESHVDTRHIAKSDRPTTLAFVQLKDGHATYDFYDENSAGRMLAIDAVPPVGAHVSGLYFGGISLACEPAAETYCALLERDGTERAVMIDPNIRPGFIKDEARFRDRLARMFAGTDIVKVSDDDLDWMYPDKGSLQAQIEALLAAGPALVIVTRGGEGAIGVLADGTEVRVAAEKAQVVDTVGAGDTFNAGVLAALSERGLFRKDKVRSLSAEDASAALSYGAKVAAVTVSRAGANPPWKSEL
ncbi:carbohydrate kinase family protein [Shimia abyssi]|uniref:Fructokinase n=1 Tax=Shimia abyssi TaxID=1662395 RepID=A0A2P8FAM8_9RHOB|nr:carbohydrate kinase [Shimia abyssi]PSL18769.1 fructokinase [Shimia abyssi]